MVPGTDDQGLAKAGFMSLPLVIDSGMSTQQKWSKNHIPGCAELLGRRSFPPNRTASYRDDSDPESLLVGDYLPLGKRFLRIKATQREKKKKAT